MKSANGAPLYMELKILEQGEIKDGKITINADNFYFSTAIVKDNEIQNNYISSNTKEILLNQIGNGTQKMIIGNVRSGDYSNSYSKTSAIGNDTTKYTVEGNKETGKNTITFTGTYVTSEGEKSFTKTVPITVDWYGQVNCNIEPRPSTIYYTSADEYLKAEGLELKFDAIVYESQNQLIMSNSSIYGTIPELNGYKPLSVKISGTNVTYTYDEETGNFTAERNAVIDENGRVTSNAYTYSYSNGTKYNTFNFTVIYPKEAYEAMGEDVASIELAVPLEAINKGYNNSHEEDGFINPYTSETAKATVVATWRKDSGTVASFNIYVGSYMGSPYNQYVISKKKPINIYQGISLEEKDDNYTVQWRAYTGTNGETDGIVMQETTGKSDEFKDVTNKNTSMENLTANKGIYFSGATNTLGETGWIKVYNADTDTVIKTFTNNDWNSYTASNPYVYEEKVKHIKIETSKTNALSYLYVYNIKELDDEYITENYTRAEFDNLQYIYSYLDGHMTKTSEETGKTTDWCKRSLSNSALYAAPTSVAKIAIKESTISTHITAEHQKITITTETSGYNEQKWKNGTFLVKLPKEIILAEINGIIKNNENVKIKAYDVYEQDGNFFIKILAEHEEQEGYSIVIDCNLTPDPRISSASRQVELYAINENACDYRYSAADIHDINENANTTEKVNYSSTPFKLDPGQSLSTTQIGSNYGKGDDVTLAPRVAKTEKGQRTAEITVTATNNYSWDIEDVKILGVIPFEGNKFVISGNDLGSQFTTYMGEGGITPKTEDIKDKVTIYYSTKERPNENLDDVSNGWTLSEDIEDWTKIKTYLIVVDNEYKLSPREKIDFTYQINLPEGIDYNKVSFSEHAIYFKLLTDEGRYPTSTSSAKLGFMIAKQYDLEIVKYQKNSQKTLEGITFTVTEDGAESSTIKVTDKEGKILITGLYAERNYTIQEVKTTDDYVLNDKEIKFTTYTEINEDGTESLYLVYPEEDTTKARIQRRTISQEYDEVREDSVLAPSQGDGTDYKVQIKIENEVKAKLAIHKLNENGEPLRNTKFTLSGEGKNNVVLTTDRNGIINTSGLFLNKEYTLQEIKATGYYIPQQPIKFTITNENGEFKLNYTDNGTIKTQNITTVEEIPTINLELQNEKIPTYGIKLTKYGKSEEENKTLAKAQYIIYGEGISENGRIYSTDENGVLTIDGLYEYVAGKYITGEYRLKEIYAPSGYAVNSTELKFKAYRENGTLKIEILEGESVIRKVDVEVTNTETGEITTETKTDLNIANADSGYPMIEIGVEDNEIFSLFKYRNDGTVESPIKTGIPGTRFKITDLDGNYVIGSDGKIVGEWFDTTPKEEELPIITLEPSTATPNYKWEQRDDGTWESKGSYHKAGSVSTVTSNEFTVIQPVKLKFDWAVSSESAGCDYVYYTITNLDAKKTIGGTSTKIGGGSNSDTYEKLNFKNVEVPLEKGKYKIDFTYKKDGSVDTGLDAAFIRNLTLEKAGEIEKQGYYAVTTDEKGQVTINLGEGFYKAIEIYAEDKYDLPEKESERTHYFGIGASKAATWDWATGITGQGWNYINSVTARNDGGAIAVGTIAEYSSEIANGATDGTDINNDDVADITSSGNDDGVIIAYDENGNTLWSKTFGGLRDDELKKIIQTSDGGYVAVGFATSDTVKYDGAIISALSRANNEGSARKDGILLKLDKDGNYEWGLRIGGELDDEIQAVIETSEHNLAITGKSGKTKAFVASYSITGEQQWKQEITSSVNVDAPDLTEYSKGLMVAANTNTSTSNSSSVRSYSLTGTAGTTKSMGSYTKITSLDTATDGTVVAGVCIGISSSGSEGKDGEYNAKIYKIDNSLAYTSIYTLAGTSGEYVSDVKATSDGGILFGGWYYSNDTTGDGGLSFEGKTGTADGYVIKLNKKEEVEYSSKMYGDKMTQVTSVAETKNKNLISGGYFNSSTVTATNFVFEKNEEDENSEVSGKQIAVNKGNFDAFVISEGASGAEVAESTSLEIENKIKRFKVTTQVVKTNNVAGGTIDGQVNVTVDGIEYTEDGIRYIEKVDYGENSTKAIKITPEENYIISSIKINNVEYTNFSTDENGIVTIPIFENMQEDKHIVVQFSNTISNVEVNHYLWQDGTLTTQKVAESKQLTDKVGEKYETKPATDIDYVLITNADYYGKDNVPEGKNAEDYYIPDNCTGTYKQGEKTVVNYYYKEKTYTLTVHHYIEGTEEKVPLKGATAGETVNDEVTEGLKKGESYKTTKAGENLIDYSIYELVLTPENSEGTIEEDTVVTYYYKVKTQDLRITKVAEEDHEVTISDTRFSLYEYVGEGTATEELIDTENLSSDWQLVDTYQTSNIGLLKLEDLNITKQYRLVETRATAGRLLPNGQWKIELNPLKITAIGNPPALVNTEDGQLLLPNKEMYDLPSSGGLGIKDFYKTGGMIAIIGMIAFILIRIKQTRISKIEINRKDRTIIIKMKKQTRHRKK